MIGSYSEKFLYCIVMESVGGNCDIHHLTETTIINTTSWCQISSTASILKTFVLRTEFFNQVSALHVVCGYVFFFFHRSGLYHAVVSSELETNLHINVKEVIHLCAVVVRC